MYKRSFTSPYCDHFIIHLVGFPSFCPIYTYLYRYYHTCCSDIPFRVLSVLLPPSLDNSCVHSACYCTPIGHSESLQFPLITNGRILRISPPKGSRGLNHPASKPPVLRNELHIECAEMKGGRPKCLTLTDAVPKLKSAPTAVSQFRKQAPPCQTRNPSIGGQTKTGM